VSVQQGIDLVGDGRRQRVLQELRETLALPRHHSAYQILQHGVRWSDNALGGQVLQHLAHDIEGLGGQQGDPLCFVLQVLAGRTVTPAIGEEREDGLLLGQAGGSGEWSEELKRRAGKVQSTDVADILGDHLRVVQEELPLGFEVAQLQRQMHGNRGRVRLDSGAFRRAHVKVELAFLCGETRQAVQRIDLFGGQNRQTVRVVAHAARIFTRAAGTGRVSRD